LSCFATGGGWTCIYRRLRYYICIGNEGHKVLTINKMTFGPYEVIIYITNIIIGHRKQINYLSSFILIPYFVIIFWFFYFTNEVSTCIDLYCMNNIYLVSFLTVYLKINKKMFYIITKKTFKRRDDNSTIINKTQIAMT
jgi:hypothetical protein